MLKEGVIQESTSPWCSPILCVRKPDGRIRFCIDFREVNDVTQADGGELPHMAAQLHVLRGSKLFAALDASSGYWQVPLTDGAKPVTGFSFQGTHYEFTVLPSGVKNGPSIFARLMNKMLRHLVDRGEPIGIYFEDITVGASLPAPGGGPGDPGDKLYHPEYQQGEFLATRGEDPRLRG